ncbi:MAG: hypothetical protein QXO95_00805 [Candidatus Aenigmatarchaeota archaeon]
MKISLVLSLFLTIAEELMQFVCEEVKKCKKELKIFGRERGSNLPQSVKI